MKCVFCTSGNPNNGTRSGSYGFTGGTPSSGTPVKQSGTLGTTVGENIIATTKIRNNYHAIQSFKFPILR